MANSTVRFEDAPVQEEQIRFERVGVEQDHEIHLAGSPVDGFGWPVSSRIRVRDTLGQGLARCQWKDYKEHEPERFHFPLSFLTKIGPQHRSRSGAAAMSCEVLFRPVKDCH
jgi:hypothetical protein